MYTYYKCRYLPNTFVGLKLKIRGSNHLVSWLVVFYGISTLVDYLMPNSVYIFYSVRRWSRTPELNPRSRDSKKSKKRYLMLSCLTLGIIRCGSRLGGATQRKE